MFLTLIRHASAVHNNAFRDFDRPLKKKGIEKSRRNTEIFTQRGYFPDLLISSPAVRAVQTAKVYADAAGRAGLEILYVKSLYLPSPGDILDCVRSVSDDFSDVFLFSHNNGISWAAQEFCSDAGIIMPTGSAVRIEFNASAWTDINFGSGRRVGFIP